MNIGKILKTIRSEQDITQEELALEVKVSQEAISQIESNKQNPSIGTLIEIADVLGYQLALISKEKTSKGMPLKLYYDE